MPFHHSMPSHALVYTHARVTLRSVVWGNIVGDAVSCSRREKYAAGFHGGTNIVLQESPPHCNSKIGPRRRGVNFGDPVFQFQTAKLKLKHISQLPDSARRASKEREQRRTSRRESKGEAQRKQVGSCCERERCVSMMSCKVCGLFVLTPHLHHGTSLTP